MSTEVRKNTAGRFAHIDAMRAFAVLLVVVAHAGAGLIVPGGSGVTIFFAISGLIITLLVLREQDKTGGFAIGGFFFRRAAKILPPLIVVVLVPSLVWACFGPLDWGALAAQIFFVFNWVKASGDLFHVLPGSGVVWSLSIEEQFYLVFAAVWLALVRWRHSRVLLGSLAGAAFAMSIVMRFVLAGDPGSGTRIYYGTDTRMDGIALGVLTALLLHRWLRQGSPPTRWSRLLGSDVAFGICVVLYVVSLVVRDAEFRTTWRFTLQAIAACGIILYGFLGRDTKLKTAVMTVSSWRPVAVVGFASYSIYLVHLCAMELVRPVVGQLPPFLAGVLFVACGVGLGLLIYRVVEIPVLRWRNRVIESAPLERKGRDTGQ